MSRKLYEALFEDRPTEDEEAEVSQLLRTFAQAAARRRAARDLADEELAEGAWVESETADEEPLRLAAQDAPGAFLPAHYVNGDYRVRLWIAADGRVLAQQEAGPPGLTLDLNDQFWPLRLKLPVDVGTLANVPERLVALDEHGRRWKLDRA